MCRAAVLSLLAVLTLATACAAPGTVPGDGGPGGSPSPSALATGEPAPEPGHGTACPHLRPAQSQATEADNNTTICLGVGDQLEVFLTSTNAATWAPLQLTGGAMHIDPTVQVNWARGVTGQFYKAVSTGTAEVTSSIPACPSTSPGTVGCHAMLSFHLTVEVK
jgi:hypothetical protein